MTAKPEVTEEKVLQPSPNDQADGFFDSGEVETASEAVPSSPNDQADGFF